MVLPAILSAASKKSVSNYEQTTNSNFAIIAGRRPGIKIIPEFYNLEVWKDLKIEGVIDILLIFKDWSKFHITIRNINIFDEMLNCTIIAAQKFSESVDCAY